MRTVVVGGEVASAADVEVVCRWSTQRRGNVIYEVDILRRFISVTRSVLGESGPQWRVLLNLGPRGHGALQGVYDVANKFIRAAAVAAGPAGGSCDVTDATLFAKRPAMAEYMSSVEGADGGVREPSVLMVCTAADGVRVGLKDEDAGGWLWRNGSTFKECLDSIEKALADGTAKFVGPRPKRGKGR